MKKKKIFSLILTLTMIFTATAMTLPAMAGETPDGIGISSLDEITDFSGKYYLKSNIGSADQPSSTTITAAFTGTLNGNGNIIYTSAPLFNNLQGATITNLTVEGSIIATTPNAPGATNAIMTDATENRVGVIANLASASAVTISNVTVNAMISCDTVTNPIVMVGGFIGRTAAEVSFENCAYNGGILFGSMNIPTADVKNGTAVVNKYNASYDNHFGAGGFVGYAGGAVSMTNCDNHADITMQEAKRASVRCVPHFGGLVGLSAAGLTVTDCTNNGAITVQGGGGTTVTTNQIIRMGGLLGGSIAGAGVSFSVNNSKNTGDLSVTTSHTQVSLGGLLGNIQGTGVSSITGCVNEGNIIAKNEGSVHYAAGIVAYMAGELTICKTVNKGDVSSSYQSAGFVARWRKKITVEESVNLGEIVTNGSGSLATTSTAKFVAAGFLSYGMDHQKITLNKCANYGNVTISGETPTATNTYMIAGGLVAYSGNTETTYTDCANYGTVTATPTRGISGGIVGMFGQAVKHAFIRCANFGTIVKSTDEKQALLTGNQILGYAALAKTAGCSVIFTDCYGVEDLAVGTDVTASTWNAYMQFTYTDLNMDVELDSTGFNSADHATAAYLSVKLNETFAANKGAAKGAAAAKSMSALEFGSTWILREDYPELSCVKSILKETNPSPQAATVYYEGIQVSESENNVFNARFVTSIEGLSYTSVGYKLYIAEQGNKEVLWKENREYVAFSSLIGSTKTGMETYTADDMIGDYISALTVTGLDNTKTYNVVLEIFTENGDVIVNGESWGIIISNGMVTDQYLLASVDR